MSEYTVPDISFIQNCHIYDLDESIRASKFPMSTTTRVSNEITDNTRKLGSCKTGTGHDNFLNGIRVSFDWTFSNKLSVELERYHFLDFVSSQSTMHRITKFNLKEQCNRYVDYRIIDIVQEKINEYNRLLNLSPANSDAARKAREKEMEGLYLCILYNIPSGFQLTARMTTNYRQLKTIYQQRKNHRLPEWREFCKWCESLPHFKELCLGGEAE